MSSHQPFDNDLALYQQYSNLALYQHNPSPTEPLMNQNQNSNQVEGIMSTHTNPQSQSQNETNNTGNDTGNRSQLFPPAPPARTRTVSYNAPVASSTWPNLGRGMVDPLSSLSGVSLVQGFSNTGSYPPTTHQRHASYHGGMTAWNPQPQLQSLPQSLSQPLPHSQLQRYDFLASDFQYQMAPTQATGTCQPQDIFKKSATEALFGQTTLDTPDTSARATPIDDGRYLSVQKQIDPVAPNDWRTSSGTTSDSMPTIERLHIRQNSGSSTEDMMETSSQTSDFDDLALDGYTPAVLPRMTEAVAVKKKRTRTPQACEACRKRKAKVSSRNTSSESTYWISTDDCSATANIHVRGANSSISHASLQSWLQRNHHPSPMLVPPVVLRWPLNWQRSAAIVESMHDTAALPSDQTWFTLLSPSLPIRLRKTMSCNSNWKLADFNEETTGLPRRGLHTHSRRTISLGHWMMLPWPRWDSAASSHMIGRPNTTRCPLSDPSRRTSTGSTSTVMLQSQPVLWDRQVLHPSRTTHLLVSAKSRWSRLTIST